MPLGTEQIAVARTAEGWAISSSGRLGAPIDLVARRMQVRYTEDWRPLEFTFDGSVKGQVQSVHTVMSATTATTDIALGGQTSQKRDTIDPHAVLIMPNSFFGAYEAVATHLRAAPPGTDIPAYAVGGVSFVIRTGESADDRIQTATRVSDAQDPRDADASGHAAGCGHLGRRRLPHAAFQPAGAVARRDSRGYRVRRGAARARVARQRRTGPHSVERFFARGHAVEAAAGRRAAAAGGRSYRAGPDRTIATRPWRTFRFSGSSAAIADAGFIVLRYDKRGVGQSGGRAESAGSPITQRISRAAVKLLSDREDVDGKRIAVIGHSEGAVLALLAAAKEKKDRGRRPLATPGVRARI